MSHRACCAPRPRSAPVWPGDSKSSSSHRRLLISTILWVRRIPMRACLHTCIQLPGPLSCAQISQSDRRRSQHPHCTPHPRFRRRPLDQNQEALSQTPDSHRQRLPAQAPAPKSARLPLLPQVVKFEFRPLSAARHPTPSSMLGGAPAASSAHSHHRPIRGTEKRMRKKLLRREN